MLQLKRNCQTKFRLDQKILLPLEEQEKAALLALLLLLQTLELQYGQKVDLVVLESQKHQVTRGRYE